MVGRLLAKGLLKMFWKEGMGKGAVNNLDEFSDDGSDASGSDACMNGLHTAMLKPGLPLVSANCVGILWPRCCSRTLANLPANSESPTYKEITFFRFISSKSQVLTFYGYFRPRYE